MGTVEREAAPIRPILAADAFIRQYISDRGREWVVVRNLRGRRVVIDNTTRHLLELCDGEHDLETIARLSGRILPDALPPWEVKRRLDPMFEAGSMVDAEKRVPAILPEREHPGIRLVRLDEEEAAALTLGIPPTLGFDCDGSGSCCKLYDRVGLSNEDAARIQHLYAGEYVPGGLYPESALFLGRPGRDPFEYDIAVTDGACVMLNRDGWCDIHVRFGKDSKPKPCSIYPLRDVYCEGTLHVGVAVECRCVIKFASGPSIRPLAEEVLGRRKVIRNVECVADTMLVLGDRVWKRAEYLAWRHDAALRLGRAHDPARWALGEAARLAGGGLGEGGRHLTVLLEIANRVQLTLAGEVVNVEEIYAENDYQRGHLKWGAEAATRLRESLRAGRLPDAPEFPPVEGERLAAEQALHIHSLLRARSLSVGLFALAFRLWLARAGQHEAHPAPLMPVSACEYLHRAYGVGAVSDTMQDEIEACFASEEMT